MSVHEDAGATAHEPVGVGVGAGASGEPTDVVGMPAVPVGQPEVPAAPAAQRAALGPSERRVTVPRVPRLATAQRPRWAALPATLRSTVEARLGSAVVDARSQDAGFTPGLASRLLLADGRRFFVKAASTEQTAWVVDAYRRECEVTAALPPGTHAPRALWTVDHAPWFLAVHEDVEGRHPERPWREDELSTVLAMLTEHARLLTPPPSDLVLAPVVEELATELGLVRALDLPWRDECVTLAERALAEPTTTMVHTDVRDDNILLTADGAVTVDWNFVATGPAWFDTVMLLVSAHGDGLDTDAVLAREPLTRDVDPDLVDGLLALLLGYFSWAAVQEHVDTSPHLRTHQAWYRDATWSWLSSRRGWERPPAS